jgi:hypothetical protein
VNKTAPRSRSGGRSRHLTHNRSRAPASRRRSTNSNPPWPKRRTARLKGGTSCTATRTATTELPNSTAATNAPALAASRSEITAPSTYRRSAAQMAKLSGVERRRVRARGAPPRPSGSQAPNAAHRSSHPCRRHPRPRCAWLASSYFRPRKGRSRRGRANLRIPRPGRRVLCPRRRSKILALQVSTARRTVGDLFGVGLTRIAVVEEYPSVLPANPPELSPDFVSLLARAI